MNFQKKFILVLCALFSITLSSCQKSEKALYKRCLDFLEEVYAAMDKNYYQFVDRQEFEEFIEKFNTTIYPQLRQEGKSIDYVRWRSASYMIQDLKSSEDIFSELYPPEPAQEYKTQVLGKVETKIEDSKPKRELGIEGDKVEEGLKIVRIEPRSDAYMQGLRVGDTVVMISDTELKNLEGEKIAKLLNPDADSTVNMRYVNAEGQEKNINVLAKEFFKQMLFMKPVKVPGVYCLHMQQFNRKTFEDMFRYLKFFQDQGPIKGLILDLRGNPGGPPLAAREISSFFLSGGEEFASFKRKNKSLSTLDVPKLNEKFRYHGPMVILIDKQSGSSSELFSGILQRRGRAFLMGTNSAGQVMLKSMFSFSDGSMALLITARGHHPDGTVFSFEGLTPDKVISDESVDMVDYAAKFLYYITAKVEK